MWRHCTQNQSIKLIQKCVYLLTIFKPWDKAYFYSQEGVILISYFKTQCHVGICKNYPSQGKFQQGTICQRTGKMYQLGWRESKIWTLHLVLREFSWDVPRCFIKGFCRNCSLKNRRRVENPSFLFYFTNSTVCHYPVLIDKIRNIAGSWTCIVFYDIYHLI